MSISKILQEPTLGSVITVKGWVRSFRSNRFIALNDGSALANLQCVVDFENEDENQLKRITTGACLAVTGELVESQGKGQSVEINVQSFEVLGDAPVEEYPLQPKKHSHTSYSFRTPRKSSTQERKEEDRVFSASSESFCESFSLFSR